MLLYEVTMPLPIKRKSLITLFLNLGWPQWLAWLTECSESDTVRHKVHKKLCRVHLHLLEHLFALRMLPLGSQLLLCEKLQPQVQALGSILSDSSGWEPSWLQPSMASHIEHPSQSGLQTTPVPAIWWLQVHERLKKCSDVNPQNSEDNNKSLF